MKMAVREDAFGACTQRCCRTTASLPAAETLKRRENAEGSLLLQWGFSFSSCWSFLLSWNFENNHVLLGLIHL